MKTPSLMYHIRSGPLSNSLSLVKSITIMSLDTIKPRKWTDRDKNAHFFKLINSFPPTEGLKPMLNE